MAISVWSNVFQLHMSPLTEAHAAGLTQSTIDKCGVPKMGTPGVPIALRWVCDPAWNLTRAPYKLYRRRRSSDDLLVLGEDLLAQGVVIAATATKVEWGNGWWRTAMFDVGVQLAPSTQSGMRVYGLDATGERLPGQSVLAGAAAWVRLRGTGLCAIEVEGAGTVVDIRGIPADKYVGLAGQWVLAQLVGMPVTTNEVPVAVYSNASQGYAPAGMTGRDAAAQRLAIAASLQLPMPAIPGSPTSPTWKAPDPALLLKEIREGATGANGDSIWKLVRDLLTWAKDDDPLKQCSQYITSRSGGKAGQIGQNSGNGPETTFHLPATQVLALAAAGDGFAATGLGFGTVEFPAAVTLTQSGPVAPPNYLRPPGLVDPVFDYMVVQTFRHAIDDFEQFGLGIDVVDVEIAAIAELWPAPSSATGLTVLAINQQGALPEGSAPGLERPPGLDLPVTQTRVSAWNVPPTPQCYGIAVARGTDGPRLVNTPRSSGGYLPYTASYPRNVAGKPPLDAKIRHFDYAGSCPHSGQAVSRYHVIGTDVFGRWSSWAAADFIAHAPPTPAPTLVKIAYEPTPCEPVDPLAGELLIDVAWDWADRRPDVIELRGDFFLPPAQPPAPNDPLLTVPPTSFKFATNAPAKALRIVFDASGNPAIDTSQPGYGPPGATVSALIGPPPTPGSDVRPYRVVVPTKIDFSAHMKRGFVVFARATPKVDKTAWSAFTPPKLTYAIDPRPPVFVPAPPPITWTALPDVRGKARVRLDFNQGSAPGLRYVVWVASETALRVALGMEEMASDIEARAAALKAILEGPNSPDLRIFTRAHEAPLDAPEFEAVLPGAADTLFFFQLSAMAPNGVESPRGKQTFAVGVPRRVVPGAPQLRLSLTGGPPQVRVTLAPGTGPAPDGYRVFRVRRPALVTELGLMGPPVFSSADPGWGSELVALRPDEPAQPHPSRLDAVTPNWFPYFYRAQAYAAIGADDMAHGRYPGESEPSPAQEIYVVPPNPPMLIADATVLHDQSTEYVVTLKQTQIADNKPKQPGTPKIVPATVNVFTLRSDLPLRRSPLGAAYLELVEDRPGEGGTVITDSVLRVAVDELPPTAQLPTDAEAIAMAKASPGALLVRYESPTNAFLPCYKLFVRTYAPTRTVHYQVWQNGALVDKTEERVVLGVPRRARAIDPLGRVTELSLANVGVVKTAPQPGPQDM